MNNFNFLSGMQASPQVGYQVGSYGWPQQYLGQTPAIADPSQWTNGGFNFATGEQGGIPNYVNGPLSNQGAAGFGFGDRLRRVMASQGMSSQNLGLGGLQMMLNGWGSHS